MIAHVTAASLASENKSLAHPASVDSLPTSANQEDHVSMATFAARRLQPMIANTAHILGIELLAAAQGIEFLRPLPARRRSRRRTRCCARSARDADATATSPPTSSAPPRSSPTARWRACFRTLPGPAGALDSGLTSTSLTRQEPPMKSTCRSAPPLAAAAVAQAQDTKVAIGDLRAGPASRR